MTSTNLDIALGYADDWSWSVFPCHSVENGKCTCGRAECASPGKHPLTANGVLDATLDEGVIRGWFANFPKANIGIATGERSNLAVVDLDVDKGADLIDLTRDFPGSVLDTMAVRTGKGFHYYYALPDGVEIKNSQGKLGKFIDVRGSGGYVIAPPSLHVSGKKYQWVEDFDNLRDFPAEWLSRLQKSAPLFAKNTADVPPKNKQTGNSADSGLFVPPPVPLFEIPDDISSGSRHHALTKAAGVMRRTGFSSDEIEQSLLLLNQRICKPPVPNSRVHQIARSFNSYDQDKELAVVADDSITNCDDVSIAKMFVAKYQTRIRFNSDAKKWLVWCGTHWKNDRTDEVLRIAAKFSQNLYVIAPSLVQNQSDMTTVQRQIKRSNTNTGLRAFLDISKAYLSLTAENLDTNGYLLNCKNGTVDLRTGKLKKHDSSDLITKIINHDYDARAAAPNWEKFLLTVQPIDEHREFLRKSLGYSLLGVARERAFWILHGSGNNGKSIFIDLWRNILGDFASSLSSASIMASKGDKIPNDIARLAGKRFAVIPETEENERINASLIKSLSGGDKITARFLFGEFFDFDFVAKIWIATNHKPTITDHSKGFWDRVKIIPFTVDIPKDQIIKKDNLMAQLLSESSGILNWAISGVRDYFAADGLEVPASIQSEIEQYKYEQDSIAQFLDEKCTIGDLYAEDNTALYEAYKDFCNKTGEYPRHQRRFSQNLKERGLIQRRGTTRIWQGLMLK